MLQARIANILRNRKLLKQKFSQKMTTSESPAEIEIQALALNPIDAKFLEQLEETVKAHLSDSEFDVGALAKEMALSRSAFYNKLKALSCMSPNEFIMNARLKYAAELLRNHPELQITEIAYRQDSVLYVTSGIASKPVSISHHKSTEESEKSRSAIVAERDSLFDTLSLLITCFLNFILFLRLLPILWRLVLSIC